MNLKFQIKSKIKDLYNIWLYKCIISSDYEGKDEYKKEIDYLRKNKGLAIFPYEFVEKYKMEDVDVRYDEQNDRYYALVADNKKLYLWKGCDKQNVATLVSNISMEQDIDSPHRYFTDDFAPSGGVFCDIGSAEGMEALSVIDQVDKMYIFECESKWLDALNHTFEPYMDKTRIINKYVSDTDSEEENTIKLDSVLSKEENIDKLFIKMDVEGAELKVLHGMESVLTSYENVMLAVAVYHTATGAMDCKNYLESLGYECEFADKYMLFIYDKIGQIKPPYFRHGLLRAKKSTNQDL